MSDLQRFSKSKLDQQVCPHCGNPVPIAPESFINAETAARFLAIKRTRLLRLTRAGKIPGHPLDATKDRKTWRYLYSELREVVAAGVVPQPLAEAGRQSTITTGSPRKGGH